MKELRPDILPVNNLYLKKKKRGEGREFQSKVYQYDLHTESEKERKKEHQ